MAIPITRYSMLHTIAQNPESIDFIDINKILKRFKLIGFIIHDPQVHKEFHNELAKMFEKIDYVSGNNFLIFLLTDPPQKWFERSDYAFKGIGLMENPLNPLFSYETEDKSETAFTLAHSLGIDYDDLPVIVLTDDLQSGQTRVFRTCSKHLEKQMTEIGYFCHQNVLTENLTSSLAFDDLIRSVDLCNGNIKIDLDESISQALSDFLSFIVYSSEYRDEDDRNVEIQSAIERFLAKKGKKSINDSDWERLNLSMIGCLSNLGKIRNSESILDIDEQIEQESKIILNTFNKVLPLFESNFNDIKGSKDSKKNDETKSDKEYLNKLDYSLLIIPLFKILEIEINLSLVHWIRKDLQIEMPKYFKERKNAKKNLYKLTPFPELGDDRNVYFNKGEGKKWLSPSQSDSEIITEKYIIKKQSIPPITEIEKFVENWKDLIAIRNMAAHSRSIDKEDFDKFYKIFKEIVGRNNFKEFTTLKMGFKPKNWKPY